MNRKLILKSLILAIIVIVPFIYFAGCVEREVVSPTQPENHFLFFEVYMLPPRGSENVITECSPLWAGCADFPTYSFNKSDRCLYPNIAPPGFYDFIKFNESLKAIAGVGCVGYISGISSHLKPTYNLPYSIPTFTYIKEVGEVQVMNITKSGLLTIHFNNQTVELAPGNSWSKQIRQCGERIYIINHGFLDKDTNNKTLKMKRG